MTRVRTMAEAEALAKRHGARPEAHLVPGRVRAAERGDHRVEGEDMDGLEISPDELRRAEGKLAQLQEDLVARLRDAIALSDPLHDGSGPVAGPMRQTFLNRADEQSGVVAALVDYIEEIDEVRRTMNETLASYTQTDESQAEAFRQVEQRIPVLPAVESGERA
ncbi:hypothetical protein [Actinokineospora spheciospongiae]|nr:hypothetical protein [Actinokineospora spheciospongiae]PWW64065.1 hypothetical protein DFQ13_10331 [Actinokineospora spheciospongiae]